MIRTKGCIFVRIPQKWYTLLKAYQGVHNVVVLFLGILTLITWIKSYLMGFSSIVIFPLVVNKYFETTQILFLLRHLLTILTSISRSYLQQLSLWSLSRNAFLFPYFLQHLLTGITHKVSFFFFKCWYLGPTTDKLNEHLLSILRLVRTIWLSRYYYSHWNMKKLILGMT